MSIWKKLLWFAVAAFGLVAVIVLALSRGEQISALWIVVGWPVHVRDQLSFLQQMARDESPGPERRTGDSRNRPEDGKDFVPTNRWMVFGHHFAAIAGPGPLVGPVLAAQFGFLPGTLWILIGATLGGGVHDMIVLLLGATPRQDAGQMVKEEIGTGVGALALISVLAIMIILMAVLALVVVQALAKSPWGVFTIAMTIPVALIMGFGLRSGKSECTAGSRFSDWLGLAFAVWGGQFLGSYPAIEDWFRHDQKWLAWAIMVYGLAASILPVWMLLTPRDYLSTFLKIGTVAALAVASLF